MAVIDKEREHARTSIERFETLEEYNRGRVLSLAIYLGAALLAFAVLMYFVFTPW